MNWIKEKLINLCIWLHFSDGIPTEDDWRNPFWRLTEAMTVKVEWHRYILDLRLGFKREGKWKCYLAFWKPVTQNFWNGIFTFNIYIIKTTIKGCPMIIPRFNLVIRPVKDYYFECGAGYLFDRGEFGIKCIISKSEGSDAQGFNEGSV